MLREAVIRYVLMTIDRLRSDNQGYEQKWNVRLSSSALDQQMKSDAHLLILLLLLLMIDRRSKRQGLQDAPYTVCCLARSWTTLHFVGWH